MRRKGLNIMIIDDDPIFTRLMEKFLYENVNCTVLSFETVRVCLNSRPPEPDIVFLDYYMHDMDGLRATRMLKKRWKKAVYILISSSTRITQKRVTRFGVDVAIPKSEGIEHIVSLALRYYRFRSLMGKLTKLFILLAVLALIALFIYYKA